MEQTKPKSLLVKEISKKLTAGRMALNKDENKTALHLFAEGCSAMRELYDSVDEPTFSELNAAHRWSSKIFHGSSDALIFSWEDTTQSGAYRESAIEPLVSIYSQLLVFVHRDKEMTSEIHIKMANLLYDPDNLDAFDQHYSMALSATPDKGDAYERWASVFESQGSSKQRKHAIEILKQGVMQPSLREGEYIRLHLLEQLIHRCTKERQTEDAEQYTKLLHELRPIKPVAADLKIRRLASCPCGSGKKYKYCCGALDLKSIEE